MISQSGGLPVSTVSLFNHLRLIPSHTTLKKASRATVQAKLEQSIKKLNDELSQVTEQGVSLYATQSTDDNLNPYTVRQVAGPTRTRSVNACTITHLARTFKKPEFMNLDPNRPGVNSNMTDPELSHAQDLVQETVAFTELEQTPSSTE
jgi:hypothetical protein